MNITKFLIIGLLSAACYFGMRSTSETGSTDLIRGAKSVEYNKSSLYLILRGSETKLGGFAKQYNKTDAHATHVAMGIFKDSLRIYHVNTEPQNGQHVLTESLDSFLDSEDDKYNYLAIWELENFSTSELAEMETEISKLIQQNIQFDYKFDNQSNDQLYCSEFLYKLMNKTTNNRYLLSMTKMKVPSEHVFYLKKDTLIYYPSDFFLDYPSIKPVYKWLDEE